MCCEWVHKYKAVFEDYLGSYTFTWVSSSVVEQLTVNQLVAGSNPASPASAVVIVSVKLMLQSRWFF